MDNDKKAIIAFSLWNSAIGTAAAVAWLFTTLPIEGRIFGLLISVFSVVLWLSLLKYNWEE